MSLVGRNFLKILSSTLLYHSAESLNVEKLHCFGHVTLSRIQLYQLHNA